MTTVGFIGSGMIGGTVARLSLAAGHDVVLSNSRGPDTLKDLVRELGPRARAATAEGAADAGDFVVVAIPLKAYRSVPVRPLVSKIVLDADNYYPARDGQIADLDASRLTSSELLQHHVRSLVVKVFNNIYYRHLASLARPAGAADRSYLPIAADRSYLPIAGDDAQAKAAVTTFLGSIGYGAVDVGPLGEGWRQQPGQPVYGTPYGPYSDERGRPASAGTIRAALAAAAHQ
jgi:predicted dinucleotide-binding enzyme